MAPFRATHSSMGTRQRVAAARRNISRACAPTFRKSGNEADAAQGISEGGAANVDEKGDEWRLIDVSPTEMITARNVIEFVSEIAIAVVEVDVKEEFGEGDGPDDGHSGRKKRGAVTRGRECGGSAGHEENRIQEWTENPEGKAEVAGSSTPAQTRVRWHCAKCVFAQYCQFTFTDEVPLVGTVY